MIFVSHKVNIILRISNKEISKLYSLITKFLELMQSDSETEYNAHKKGPLLVQFIAKSKIHVIQ